MRETKGEGEKYTKILNFNEITGRFIPILNTDNAKKENYSIIIETHILKEYWLCEVIRL